MSEATATAIAEAEAPKIFAVEDILLPLNLEATNPEHVHTLELLRERLVAFLKAAQYCPKKKDTAMPNTFRDALLVNFAKLLVSEKLVDNDGELVSLYDAIDFTSWLYHGYKWLNAAVCEQYNKADGKPQPILGYVKDVVDDVAVIKEFKRGKTVDAVSKYTNVDWSAWSNPQMIGPLHLYLSDHVTSHKKALYHFFNPSSTSKTAPHSAKSTSPDGSVPSAPALSTVADHVSAAITTTPRASKPPKAKKSKPVVSGGGAGGDQ